MFSATLQSEPNGSIQCGWRCARSCRNSIESNSSPIELRWSWELCRRDSVLIWPLSICSIRLVFILVTNHFSFYEDGLFFYLRWQCFYIFRPSIVWPVYQQKSRPLWRTWCPVYCHSSNRSTTSTLNSFAVSLSQSISASISSSIYSIRKSLSLLTATLTHSLCSKCECEDSKFLENSQGKNNFDNSDNEIKNGLETTDDFLFI